MLIDETKEKILKHSGELFMQYGVRSVTMDDVAREVSMSKKTLYQYFDNKDELVGEVAKRHINEELAEFEVIEKSAENAIHEIILMSKCIRRYVFRMNPSLLHDLQRYHGKAWELFKEFKTKKIRGFIKRILTKGIEEGCFRESIDPEILSVIRVELVQLAFDNKIFPRDKFDFREVQMQLLDHFIYGILTEKGRKTYQEYSETEITN